MLDKKNVAMKHLTPKIAKVGLNMAGTRNPFGRRSHPGSRMHLKIRTDSPTNRSQKNYWQSGLESYARAE
jgi:hypothetical protein